jgi:hypothetical protein
MATYLSDNWRFDVAEALATDVSPIIAFGDRLAAAGWVIITSSNTSSINASTRNDATRWNNTDAWEHWRDPLGNRDLTIQRGATNRGWRMYVGQYGDPFSGGTLTAAPVGSLTRVQVIGAGDAYDSSFIPNPATNYEYHIAVSQTGRGQTGDVYEFYLVIQLIAGSTVTSVAALFAVNTLADGTYGVIDYEPWVVFRTLSTATMHGLSGQTAISTLSVSSMAGYTSGTQLNPYTGTYDIQPTFISDNTGGVEQRKGIGESFFYFTTATPAVLDTFNNAVEGRSLIRFAGNWFVPWPHGVTTGTGTDYDSIDVYGSAVWPFVAVGGWLGADEPYCEAELQLLLPDGGPAPVTEDTRNRVWDTVAGGWHVWVTTNGADPTGISYDGPGTYGVDTSNYSVI